MDDDLMIIKGAIEHLGSVAASAAFSRISKVCHAAEMAETYRQMNQLKDNSLPANALARAFKVYE